jgi:hypothetical protein
MPRLQNVLFPNLATSANMCHLQRRWYTCNHKVTNIKKCKNYNEEKQTVCPGVIEYAIEVLDSICPTCMRLDLARGAVEKAKR